MIDDRFSVLTSALCLCPLLCFWRADPESRGQGRHCWRRILRRGSHRSHIRYHAEGSAPHLNQQFSADASAPRIVWLLIHPQPHAGGASEVDVAGVPCLPHLLDCPRSVTEWVCRSTTPAVTPWQAKLRPLRAFGVPPPRRRWGGTTLGGDHSSATPTRTHPALLSLRARGKQCIRSLCCLQV